MPEPKKNDSIAATDDILQTVGYIPDVLHARDSAMVKGLGNVGKKAAAAKASSAALRKFLGPVEYATHAIEAIRLITDENVRKQRFEDINETGEKGFGGRWLDSFSNPVGTIYGMAESLADSAGRKNIAEIEIAGAIEEMELRKAMKERSKRLKESRGGGEVAPSRSGFIEQQRQKQTQEALGQPSIEERKRIALLEKERENQNNRALVRSYLENNGLV